MLIFTILAILTILMVDFEKGKRQAGRADADAKAVKVVEKAADGENLQVRPGGVVDARFDWAGLPAAVEAANALA